MQELEQIELVWMMTSEWEDHWNIWKSGRFIDVETGDMEEISTTLFRKLQKMSRELKVCFTPHHNRLGSFPRFTIKGITENR